MKVIFLKDVPKLGKRDDVKDINDGYVRNFLLPQKLVELATPLALSNLKKKLGDRKAGQESVDLRNKLLIDSITGQSFVVKAKSNDKGALFKSITPKDIISVIKESAKIDAPIEIFESGLHLKNLGEIELNISLGSHKGKINLSIVKE